MNTNEMQEMMQRAQQMQSKMGELQEALTARRFAASAGGGMVEATVSGGLRVLAIEIEPTLIQGDDRSMIQDLVAAAVNAALTKAQEAVAEEMARMQQSMLAGIPGMPGPPPGAGS
ncbi:MAG: YbaB/EbfC family nucleoid-associated protein [bacterium]|nr:YbaB/EbfC family nucleoid-associated protein [Deltaproteobacteria bacterium]MCP4907881.1 YbaB/EbfC family nucleoid-associated protein [bacterium]